MRDAYIFRDPGCAITPDPLARCRRCDGTADLIEGDGEVVCRDCIGSLGAIAGDPHVTTQRVLAALQLRHGDVVILARKPGDHRGQGSRLVWDWIG